MPSETVRQLSRWYERFFMRPPEAWLNGLALWAVIVALFIPPEAGIWWRLGALGFAFVLVHYANKAVARDRVAQAAESEARFAAMMQHFETMHARSERILTEVLKVDSLFIKIGALPAGSTRRAALVEELKSSELNLGALLEEAGWKPWTPVLFDPLTGEPIG